MQKIRIDASKAYEVLIARGLHAEMGSLAKVRMNPSRVLIVTDDCVAPLYLDTVYESLEKAGFKPETLILPHGEEEKTPARLVNILEYAAQKGLTRSDRFAALGGGVVGDITGLAAGLYLRGVEYLQIPTTFLSAIDSSVGGKTAVNLQTGKNLMGMFLQPALVVCDLNAFSTLQDTAFADGVSEAVKYAVVFDPKLFETIEKGLRKTDMPAHPVARCVHLKNSVVSADEFDHADRQLLNFGHTVGHAIEKLSGYTMSHGQAVAAGMVVMTCAAEKFKICQRPFSQRLKALLEQYALPVRCNYSADDLAEAALSDKKRRGDFITLIVPQQLGQCVLHTVAASSLKEFFAAGLSG